MTFDPYLHMKFLLSTKMLSVILLDLLPRTGCNNKLEILWKRIYLKLARHNRTNYVLIQYRQQREKRQQQKERRDSFDFYKQNEIGRTWHRRYLIADEDDEEIGSNSNSCYSSCTAAINKRLSPLMYNVLVNQCQQTCRKLINRNKQMGDW